MIDSTARGAWRGLVSRGRSRRCVVAPSTFGRATMLADLDLLLTAVFCTADDLLPEASKNAPRRVTDAEVVTLCVAQQMMNISSDREFLAVASQRLGHLFPTLPKQPGLHKRRRRLA